MPVNLRHPLSKVIEAACDYASKNRRRVTLEYVLLGGVNDRKKDAVALATLARKLPCKINIIEYNSFPDSGFRPPTPGSLARFVEYLYAHAPAVTVRRSKGADIEAACGQLYIAGLKGKRASYGLATGAAAVGRSGKKGALNRTRGTRSRTRGGRR